MNFKIKIGNQRYVAIKALLLLVLFERFLESCGFSHSIIFITDFLNLFLLLEIIAHHKVAKILNYKLVKIHLIFMGIGIVTSLLNEISVVLVLWSVRNLFRFYIFYGACILFLSTEDAKKVYSMFENIFFLNAIMIFIQYIMGYRQDFLGGIFGFAKGANAYNNIFLIIMSAYGIAKYLYKRQNALKTGIVIVIALIEAVLSETKVFLFELLFIVFICVFVKGVIEKKYMAVLKGIGIGLLVVVGVVIGAKYIAIVYPSLSNSDFMSIDGLKYILTRTSGYTGYGDLNRLTVIGTINHLEYFNDSILHRIFGMGLGAAEYSSSSQLLQSKFYEKYAYLHYYWFSHAWMYLECGYVGLIGYIVGFYSNARVGLKRVSAFSKIDDFNPELLTGIVVSIMTLLLCVYNQSLRLESAYLLYFAMSAILIGVRDKNGKETIG